MIDGVEIPLWQVVKEVESQMRNTSRPKTATDFRHIPNFSNQIHPPQSRFQQRNWGFEFSLLDRLIVCSQGQNSR